MARINLLPWRDELRRRRRDEFLTILGFAAVVACAIAGGVHFYYVELIAYQNQRNTFMESQIAQLAEKIKEIAEIEKQRNKLVERIRAIEQLQAERPGIVKLFDAIAQTLPEAGDSVSLNSFEQKERALTIKGIARSNARVSNYMKRVEKSEVIGKPKLKGIETKTNQGQRYAEFELLAEQLVQKADAETAETKP